METSVKKCVGVMFACLFVAVVHIDVNHVGQTSSMPCCFLSKSLKNNEATQIVHTINEDNLVTVDKVMDNGSDVTGF
jgi:hypothetical protein